MTMVRIAISQLDTNELTVMVDDDNDNDDDNDINRERMTLTIMMT